MRAKIRELLAAIEAGATMTKQPKRKSWMARLPNPRKCGARFCKSYHKNMSGLCDYHEWEVLEVAKKKKETWEDRRAEYLREVGREENKNGLY